MAKLPIPDKKTVDWPIIIVYLCLVVIGWLMVFSTTYEEENPYAYLDPLTLMGKQSIWVIISLITFILIINIEWSFWNTVAYLIYGLSVVFLIAVLLFGSVKNGAKAWFDIGFLSFQPAELSKLGTCLALSSYMSYNKYNLNDKGVLLISLAIIFIPITLILLQPDAGSALVFLSLSIILYRKGLSGFVFVLGFILIGIFVCALIFGADLVSIVTLLLGFVVMVLNIYFNPKSWTVLILSFIALFVAYNYDQILLVWIIAVIGFIVGIYLNYNKRDFRTLTLVSFAASMSILFAFATQFFFNNVLKPHQQERINVWLRPEKCDPRGSLYNILQSKMAIGSGGFHGKGFLKGEMTMLNFVPEQTTDFIFTTIGEEQGFIGSVSVIILFLVMLYRLVLIAERTRLDFIRNFCYGVAGILFMHVFVNIGMTVGLMPVIGIPLPFISKGGTSLLIFSVIIAIVVKMDALRLRG
jgi:rod shape determining protein RodA